MSRKYLISLLQDVRSIIREDIKKLIPEKFGVIFDSKYYIPCTINCSIGLTCDGTSQHYYGFFLTWSNPHGGFQTCLISCGVTIPPDEEDERATSFAAEDIQRTLEYRLQRHDKSIANIDYLGGDNCNANKKLARPLDVPFIGYASHRLNLAVKNLLDKSENAVSTKSTV